jgi:hypothetical protein
MVHTAIISGLSNLLGSPDFLGLSPNAVEWMPLSLQDALAAGALHRQLQVFTINPIHDIGTVKEF